MRTVFDLVKGHQNLSDSVLAVEFKGVTGYFEKDTGAKKGHREVPAGSVIFAMDSADMLRDGRLVVNEVPPDGRATILGPYNFSDDAKRVITAHKANKRNLDAELDTQLDLALSPLEITSTSVYTGKRSHILMSLWPLSPLVMIAKSIANPMEGDGSAGVAGLQLLMSPKQTILSGYRMATQHSETYKVGNKKMLHYQGGTNTVPISFNKSTDDIGSISMRINSLSITMPYAQGRTSHAMPQNLFYEIDPKTADAVHQLQLSRISQSAESQNMARRVLASSDATKEYLHSVGFI